MYTGPLENPCIALAASRDGNPSARPHHTDVKTRKTIETIRIGLRPKILPSGTQKMLEVPKNSVESYLQHPMSALAPFSRQVTRVATYSDELRELANRRVRHELELHDGQCWGDGTGSEICCECVEAHGEQDSPSACG